MSLSIIEMMLNAGIMVKLVMITLFLFSLCSWIIIISKSFLFHRVRSDSMFFLNEFWESRTLNEAFDAAQHFPASPEATVFITGFTELKKISSARTGEETINRTLQARLATMDNLKRAVRKAQLIEGDRLAKRLAFLATTGSATPFIGLFGTVWGIMASFHEIGERKSASLAIVAPGISEALVATAAGLAVAIPAVVFYNYFSNKLADKESEVEHFSSDFLNLIERDILSRT